jgi:hypothetical protein
MEQIEPYLWESTESHHEMHKSKRRYSLQKLENIAYRQLELVIDRLDKQVFTVFQVSHITAYVWLGTQEQPVYVEAVDLKIEEPMPRITETNPPSHSR